MLVTQTDYLRRGFFWWLDPVIKTVIWNWSSEKKPIHSFLTIITSSKLFYVNKLDTSI